MDDHKDKSIVGSDDAWMSPTTILLEKHNAITGRGRYASAGLYSLYFCDGKRKSLTSDFVSHKQQWLEHQLQIQNMYHRRLSIEYDRLLGSKYLDIDADLSLGSTARDKSKLGRSQSFSSRKEAERRCSNISDRSAIVPMMRPRSFTLPESVLGPMLRLRDLTLEEGKRKMADSQKGREGCNSRPTPEVRLVKDMGEMDLETAGELTDTSPSSETSLEVSLMLRGGSPKHRRHCTNGNSIPGPNCEPSRESSVSSALLLSPTRRRRGQRVPSPTLSLFSLSPVPMRRRSHTFSGKPGDDAVFSCFSPPRTPRHIPRDPIQPSQGSISDLSDRHSCDETDEEVDQFSLAPIQRPRARTCPENRAFQRRTKRNINNRPPTPPPMSISPVNCLTDAQMNLIMKKEKLKIVDRPLQIVPEDLKDSPSSAFQPWQKKAHGDIWLGHKSDHYNRLGQNSEKSGQGTNGFKRQVPEIKDGL